MKKVYVGMSGGVDSSVAAALLKEQGYDVVGVYMKNWISDVGGITCAWQDDYQDALAVAVKLDIPLKVYDFQTEYRRQVVDYMVANYSAGRTPNPDIMCNQEIKFKLFLNTALAEGADLIATGHYGRIAKSVELHTAKDKNKDQTYFLYRVTSEALAKTLLPIGGYTKPEVRTLAKKFKLPTANKPDSQGICFIGEVGIKDFLGEYVVVEPGDIIDQFGKIIGQHDGAIFYTIGQRHGLEVGGGLPYYVIGKDVKKNQVFVTTDLNNDKLWRTDFELTDTHWINQPPVLNQTYLFRTRHRAGFVQGELTSLGKTKAYVHLNDPERALTPGQSTVVYDGSKVLGGGIVV